MWNESRHTIERNHGNLITSFNIHLQQFPGKMVLNWHDRG